MVTSPPTVVVKEPTGGRDGGGLNPPTYGGGGDSGDNGSPDFGHQLERARAALAFVIVPVLIVFIVLTVLYITRQRVVTRDEYSHEFTRHWMRVNLPIGLLLLNTFVLLLSSLTMEWSRRQLKRAVALMPVQSIPGVSLGNERRLPWLGATVLLGLGFLGGQFMAWRELEAHGFALATSASTTFVYLLTATHAVHLAVALLVLFYAQAIALLHKPLEHRHIVVDVTAWYWHFMALLWIYIFALLKFMP
jgi:cytochrome c oxidase subunit III